MVLTKQYPPVLNGNNAGAQSSKYSATGVVTVGEDGLWLTDYTQLTMAGQFADESALSRYAQRLLVEPGGERVTARDPKVPGRLFSRQ